MLTIETRKSLFKYLGLGEYTPSNILKFKKKYLASKYCNSKYDTVAENLLRHCYNVKRHTTNFSPEEFKCKCGKCSGYPTFMKENELKNLQTIRTKFSRPMTITSGMRCKSYNSSLRGSSPTSRHMYGMAADFYIPNVTDTLAKRKTLIAYMKTLPAHNWSYGNGWCSKGYAVNAPNMGNAVHLDSLVTSTRGQKICAEADRLIRLGFKYCFYKDNSGYPHNAGNCIRYGALCVRGGGIAVSTKQDGLLNDAFAETLLNLCLKGKQAEALARWEKRNGKGWQLIWNGGKKIPIGSLREGDVLLCFSGREYKHTAIKHRGKNIADCNHGKNAKIRLYTKVKKDDDALSSTCKIAFRYTK